MVSFLSNKMEIAEKNALAVAAKPANSMDFAWHSVRSGRKHGEKPQAHGYESARGTVPLH
jgi:hypothetical protein